MSVSKGKFRLSDMSLDFVSLVPAGDDPMAQVVIAKADPDTTIRNPQEGNMGDEKIAKDDLAPEVVAYIDALESEVDDLSKSVEDLTAERDELAKAAAPTGIVKSEEDQRKEMLEKADPAIRALIEKQEKDLEEVRKAAEAERNARLDREYISKAETLPMINSDKATLGGLLRRVTESVSKEDAEALETILRAANEQITKSNLFTEVGRGGADTVVSKSVEAKAEELRKADPSLTAEQAQAKVYEMYPDLLQQALSGE